MGLQYPLRLSRAEVSLGSQPQPELDAAVAVCHPDGARDLDWPTFCGEATGVLTPRSSRGQAALTAYQAGGSRE
jgi:hypothetical protein